MADVVKQTIEKINENVDKIQNATANQPGSFEGMIIAYSSLIIMALFPIFYGAVRSVEYHKQQKVTDFFTFLGKY